MCDTWRARCEVEELPLTQYYIVGEFSSLLGELTPEPGDSLHDAVESLRHRVEGTPVRSLHDLAHEALDLTDAVCWSALDRGDVEGFRRYAETAVALADFAVGAGLLP